MIIYKYFPKTRRKLTLFYVTRGQTHFISITRMFHIFFLQMLEN